MRNSQNTSILYERIKMLQYMTYLLNPRHNMTNITVFVHSSLRCLVFLYILANILSGEYCLFSNVSNNRRNRSKKASKEYLWE